LDIPLPLALEDLVPTVLSALGLLAIARIVAASSAISGRIAYLGVVLVTTAGASRSAWKIALGAGGPDLQPVHAVLFPLLAPGFALLAISLLATWGPLREPVARHERLLSVLALVCCAVLGTLVVAAGIAARPAELMLIGIATAANTIVGVLLIRAAVRARLRWAAWCFAANLATVFLLAGMARLSDQLGALQAVEQAVNTASQAAFLAAAMGLERAGRAADRVAARKVSQPWRRPRPRVDGS